jgi:hypothetical protein
MASPLRRVGMITPSAVVRSPDAFSEDGDVSTERPHATTRLVLVVNVKEVVH